MVIGRVGNCHGVIVGLFTVGFRVVGTVVEVGIVGAGILIRGRNVG